MNAREPIIRWTAAVLCTLLSAPAQAGDLGKITQTFTDPQESMELLNACLNTEVALKWTDEKVDGDELARDALFLCDDQVGELAQHAPKKKRSYPREDVLRVYRKALDQDIERLRRDNPGYAQCVSGGGNWMVPAESALAPLNLGTRCDARTADAGKACTRQGDCAGACEVTFRACNTQSREKAGPEIFNSGQRCYTARCTSHLFDKPAVILNENGGFASPYAR